MLGCQIIEKDNCGFGFIVARQQGNRTLIDKALGALVAMKHRTGINHDGRSGDGCGLLFKNDGSFFRKVIQRDYGVELPSRYGVGVIFFEPKQVDEQKQILEANLRQNGCKLILWRVVPIDKNHCGEIAAKNLPHIEQAFVAGEGMSEEEFNLALFKAKRFSENFLTSNSRFHIASISTKIVCYKGMLSPEDFSRFFPDLADPDLTSSICVFHDRFSTNTSPSWDRAQPFSMVAHNGEINTISGNREWALARKKKLINDKIHEGVLGETVIARNVSDSRSLNDILEIMYFGGLPLPHSIRLTIQPAFNGLLSLSESQKSFHLYNYLNMEPWDGPAGVVCSDGRYVVGFSDRNGLRPARYTITDDYIALASETGVFDLDWDTIREQGRLGPGEMLAIDTDNGSVYSEKEVDEQIIAQFDYDGWVNKNVFHAGDLFVESAQSYGHSEMESTKLDSYCKLFQFSLEEQQRVFAPMIKNAEEPTGAMGDDTPTPILSQHIRKLTDYFKQTFAQVTNPPIDSLREKLVMSLQSSLGAKANLLAQNLPENQHILFESPVLLPHEFQGILSLDNPSFSRAVISCRYPKDSNYSLALSDLTDQAVQASVDHKILVISDQEINELGYWVDALVLLGAVHHRLVQLGNRLDVSIVVASAAVRNPHELAVFIGCGADFVYPYLPYYFAIRQQEKQVAIGSINENKVAHHQTYCHSIRKSLDKGLLKIMAKMGVSTVASYRAAQLFEAVGLSSEVVDRCFRACVSQIGGLTFSLIEKDNKLLHRDAFSTQSPVQVGGLLKFVHGGEYHAYNPDVVTGLIESVKSGDYDFYKEFYAKKVNTRPISTIRDLFELSASQTSIDLAQVEPVAEITRRFDSAGMSLGALSKEAHMTLARALNAINGRSNSGEGGEDAARYGTNALSKIKQIASGRFGVTAAYLNSAEVIQIKIAQGAKPGEGGQLPGIKVDEEIARLRHASVGTSLISPPPHHDIYSIEDLAQLIYDLKQVNPEALVSVKLVASPGVGIVASGVAKAYADLITVSGYDGGTGASPLSSIMHAGSPWELGLTEAHWQLVENGLRERVILQTDGGLKTGLDIVKAAILGAESFGFGTAAMISMGCKYLRICHLNNCPTGIATQNPKLREEFFVGNEQMVINFFQFVAQEVREILAQLGFKSLTELIGRADLLNLRGDNLTEKQAQVDFQSVLDSYCENPKVKSYYGGKPNNSPEISTLNDKILAKCQQALEFDEPLTLNLTIRSQDRAVGTNISGKIAKKYGAIGLTKGIRLNLKGSAGQSLGAWLIFGVSIDLEGESNDYVGKGLSGGEIVIRNPINRQLHQDFVTIGNTCLYGATSGKLFVNGVAGERFAVRNSGALAVVEGVGVHCCEYMTGGVVFVLGNFRENFGAGMTGGLVFVYDRNDELAVKINPEFIEYVDITPNSQASCYVKETLDEHHLKTQSVKARYLLDNFDEQLQFFRLVKPKNFDEAIFFEQHMLLNDIRKQNETISI